MKLSKVIPLLGLNLLMLSMSTFAEDYEVDIKSQSTIRIQLDNDNPFLNLFPDLLYTEDDHGFTHGLGIFYEFIPKKELFDIGEKWSFSAKSDLYTKDLRVPGVDTFPNDPQLFNEITEYKITWDNLLANQDNGKVYYLVGAQFGEVNDMDDSGWGAVGQQRRWHVFKNGELTPETTPTYLNKFGTTQENYYGITAAAGKIIKFDDSMGNCQCEVNRIKIEAGTELVSVDHGSKAYMFIGVDKTLLRYGKNSSVGALLDNKASLYSNGTKNIKTFGGLYIKSGSWTTKTGFTKTFGDENDDFFKYTDDDTMWMLSIEKRM